MSRNGAHTLSFPPGIADPAPVAWEASAHELAENLAALQELLRRLAELADCKLAGLRRADAATLQACATEEGALLEEVMRVEQQRDATLARLAQGLPEKERRRAPLAEIADRFPEPLASILRARAVALREIAAQLHRKNQLAARVAQLLQSHLRAVFAGLAKVNHESVVYGPKGQPEAAGVRFGLDAVG